jgi:chemotaxis signal transduction protein
MIDRPPELGDETQTFLESGTRPWLKPSAALSRFAPQVRVEGEGRSLVRWGEGHTRYGYRIGNIGLLVSARAGCEVVSIPTIARIPTTPQWLLGVANLRGGLVPIFDLQALLELPADHAAEPRFALIFDRGERAVGILVAAHPVAVASLEPLTQQPPLPAAVREFVSAAFRDGPSVWLEFDHQRFFASIAERMTA